MLKTIIHASEWQDLLENGAPDRGHFYKLDPDVAGRHAVFDLANEKSNQSIPTPVLSCKQATNRQWYERDKLKRFAAIVASSIKRPKARE